MTAEERTVLAGELALGVLDGAERADALRLMLADPEFAREVERWRDRFAVWFDEWPEATPDPALEARVVAALPGGSVDAGTRIAANDDARGPLRLWRGMAATATAAAAALLAVLLLQPDRISPPRAPSAASTPAPLVAVLTPTGQGEPFAALVDRRTGAVTLAGALDVPPGRVAELWSIGTDATPRSLGLLGRGATPRLDARPGTRALLAPGVTLAVSIEPSGGSPTGSPTGPVVASGALRAV